MAVGIVAMLSAIAGVPVLLPAPASAWPAGAEQSVVGPASEGGDQVQVDGDWALVGGQSSTRTDVYHHEDGLWVKTQELPTGWLRLDGDVIAIGLNDTSVSPRTIGMYRRAGTVWSLEQLLVAPDDVTFAYGAAVIAVDGDRLAVTNAPHVFPTNGSERVYLYRYAGGSWSPDGAVARSSFPVGAGFGRNVALSGDTLAVTDQSGSVFVFVFDEGTGGWSVQGSFGPTFDGTNYITEYLSVDGDNLVASSGRGTYVFHRTASTWQREATLQPTPDYGTSEFGMSSAVSGDYVAVGDQCGRDARRRWCTDNPLGSKTGSALLFRRDGGAWTQVAKVWPSDHLTGTGGNVFGRTIDLSGSTMLVGAKNVSRAYFYDTSLLSAVQVGEVHGLVTDATSFRSLPGVTVTLLRDRPSWSIVATTTTDATGRYRFADLEPGTYRVKFFDPTGAHRRTWWSSAPTYRVSDPAIVAPGAAAVADQALERSSGGLHGRLRAGAVGSGGPFLGGIGVRVFDRDAGYVAGATTGPNGSYEIRALPPGTYLIQFVDPTRAFGHRWYPFGELPSAASPVAIGPGAFVTADGWMAPR